MISLMAKRISSHFLSPSPHHQQHFMLLSPILRQHLSTKPSPQPQIEMPFIAEYLISSFGFSPNRALKLSTNSNLAGIKSPDRPEALRKFLSDIGLSDTQIKTVVSFEPTILGYNVDKTLRPRLREWLENGFSEEILIQLIRYCPKALTLTKTLSRLLFWRDFVINDVDLLKIISRNSLLILRDIDKHTSPRINVLKEYGLSNGGIVSLLGSGSRCMSLDLDSFRQTIELVEELGLERGSGMFLVGLKAVGSFSKDKILKKVEFYETTYGWSQEEVHSAFRKTPNMLGISDEKIKSNMDFFIEKAKLEPRRILSRPDLLTYSVKNRLVPRHHVLSILAAKGLIKNCSILSACMYTEKTFVEKYVEPYKNDVPELAQAYFAALYESVSV